MKTREPRQTIAVTARMKTGDGWQDVAIRNVSAHGMRISVAMPPKRGTYIEVRRAAQVIVARAMWVQGNDCGLRTQDVVDIPALLNPNASKAEAVIGAVNAERRRAPRADEGAHTARRAAMRIQHIAIAAAILAGAVYAGWTVMATFGAPLATASEAMGGTRIKS